MHNRFVGSTVQPVNTVIWKGLQKVLFKWKLRAEKVAIVNKLTSKHCSQVNHMDDGDWSIIVALWTQAAFASQPWPEWKQTIANRWPLDGPSTSSLEKLISNGYEGPDPSELVASEQSNSRLYINKVKCDNWFFTLLASKKRGQSVTFERAI